MSEEKTANRNTLQAVLEHAGDKVSVHWSVPSTNRDWDPYFISERELNRIAREVRDKLSSLQACDWGDIEKWDDTKCRESYGEILQDLAFAGEDLYEALLTGFRNDVQSEQEAKHFRTWFEENVTPVDKKGYWRIQIIHTNIAKATVPWGLVFTPRAERTEHFKQLWSYEDFSDFWCISYQLACRGPFLEEADELQEKRDGTMAKIAVVIERDEYDVDEFQHVGNTSQERAILDKRADYIAHNKREFRRHASQQLSRDVFWYISLRANGGSYKLGGQTLGYQDALKETGSDRIILMLVDGDAVIRNDRGPLWVKACLDVGPAGLIAVEADIDNPQLKFFGWKLLKTVLGPNTTQSVASASVSGELEEQEPSHPLIFAMENARRQLWPLSLLYGVYCNPLHVYLSPAPMQVFSFVDDLLALYKRRPTKVD